MHTWQLHPLSQHLCQEYVEKNHVLKRGNDKFSLGNATVLFYMHHQQDCSVRLSVSKDSGIILYSVVALLAKS